MWKNFANAKTRIDGFQVGTVRVILTVHFPLTWFWTSQVHVTAEANRVQENEPNIRSNHIVWILVKMVRGILWRVQVVQVMNGTTWILIYEDNSRQDYFPGRQRTTEPICIIDPTGYADINATHVKLSLIVVAMLTIHGRRYYAAGRIYD